MLSQRPRYIGARQFLVPLVLSGLLPFGARAVAAAQSADSVTKLVVLVDGSKTPEQISDDLAYQHFFLAVAAHEQPSAEERQRQDAQLAPVGLSQPDRQQVAVALGRLTTQLEAIEAAKEASDGSVNTLLGFKTQRDAAVSQAVATIQGALSADGASVLGRYITETVKRNIKIYGTAK
jgi:hypothetical protein